ncbi:MAG: hypothetical protein ABTQ34_04145 [Bdellovibrionales bacterium]
MRASILPKLFMIVLIAMTALTAASRPSQAETLDDQSIQALYASLETDIKDKLRMRQQVETRMADNYVLKLDQSTITNGLPPHRSTTTLNKQDMIKSVMKSYDSISIENSKYEIFDIKYSQDKKVAYVRNTVSTSGALLMPGNNNNSLPMTRYKDVEKCQEALTLVEGTIKFLQTACDSQLMISQ